ncbi:TonB-dependent receptor [Chitiniphilus purpureus]|uniref:TonB-dependent receptor n=1 Tax=Chitiniphilus purpureus TaxID=2981137 RepID=A0ABY6DH05_9NEIS|nr:TonB-dependent receptor [Chitiniphilus sp. CD1]UXY13630.1 TonB-dependent receptor [Chitiniphilus sp. CD1]
MAIALAHMPAAFAEPATALPSVLVTANPLGNADLAGASTVLQGQALLWRDATTLGEVLAGQPGVASTSFGPGASRPVLRGLDGDRIRLLQNGIGTLDASALSYDHAVAQDVAGVERIEVVRGPAALLYGGSAIGGVVNALDNRIPKTRIDGPTGRVRTEYGGAASERLLAGQLETGNGDYALHVDGFNRRSRALRIPGHAWSPRQRAGLGSYAPPEHEHGHEGGDGEDHPHEAHADPAQGTLPNSDSRAWGGAVGLARTWEDGHLGVSVGSYRSNYGSIAEEAVRLKLKQDRLALSFAKDGLAGPLTRLQADLAYTDYRHQELHGREVGSTFKHNGHEGRIEARHAPLAGADGIIGLQFGQRRFSALGEEAFIPDTDTDQLALFALEQWQLRAVQLSIGGRVDLSRVEPDDAGNRRFAGMRDRSFTTGSLSAGLVAPLAQGWSLAGQLAYTERAPSQYELYANGQHVATGTFERGDPDADEERATSIDAALRYQAGATRLSLGAYYGRYANFIALASTGRWCHSHGDHDHCGTERHEGESPEYRYRGVPAKLYGLEFDSSWRLLDGADKVDLLVWGDITRGANRATGEPLPRLAPVRIAGALVYSQGPWSVRGELQHAADQTKIPAGDTPTDGHTVSNIAVGYRFRQGASDWLAYLRGDNLGNEEIRYASALTRDIAPQGKRSARIGLQVVF